MDFPKAPLICGLVLFILVVCSLIVIFAYYISKERSSFWEELWTVPRGLTTLCIILAVVGLGLVIGLLDSQSDPSRFSRILRAAIALAVAFVVADSLSNLVFERRLLEALGYRLRSIIVGVFVPLFIGILVAYGVLLALDIEEVILLHYLLLSASMLFSLNVSLIIFIYAPAAFRKGPMKAHKATIYRLATHLIRTLVDAALIAIFYYMNKGAKDITEKKLSIYLTLSIKEFAGFYLLDVTSQIICRFIQRQYENIFVKSSSFGQGSYGQRLSTSPVQSNPKPADTGISTSEDVEAAEPPVNSRFYSQGPTHTPIDAVSSRTEIRSTKASTATSTEPYVYLHWLNGPSDVPVQILKNDASVACYIIARFWKHYIPDLHAFSRALDFNSFTSLDIAVLSTATWSLHSPLPPPNLLCDFPEYEEEFHSFIERSLQIPVDSKAEQVFARMMEKGLAPNFTNSQQLEYRWRSIVQKVRDTIGHTLDPAPEVIHYQGIPTLRR